jgi:hypothetical protein
MLRWLKSLFQAPEPAGPPQSLRQFGPADKPISQDGVSLDTDGWRIVSSGSRTIRLFEAPDPGVENCIVTYRAQMKTEHLQKGAYLEMWCRFPGRGEFFSKGFHHRVKGTNDWASYETPFYLKKGQRPDLIKLNLILEGTGTVWLRNLELLQTPFRE